VKTKITNLFKEYRALRVLLPVVISLLLLGATLIPYAQADITYLDVEGTYTVNSTIGAKYLSGAKHANMVGSTLTITTQNDQVISSASLTTFGDTVDLTGLVGSGGNPWISLTGDDGTDTYLSITGRVLSSGGVVKGISGGMITGYIISDGYKWDASDTGTAATYTGANSYGGSGYCTLLTAGAGAGAECVQFNLPINTFKLSQMDTLKAGSNGLSFGYNLQDTKSPGPQIGLRFAPAGVTGTDLFSSISHVDITIAPFYSTTGDGTWKQYNITKDSARIYYYGNDPVDQTSFSNPGPYLATLDLAEASINTNAAMTAHSASASNWVLTAVYIDLYEAGVRTCYIDNVQIGRYTYTLEPGAFSCAFKATISD
jgi:hypothetical protein